MTQVKEIADHVIEIPETGEALSSILATIPFQLLSYHIAVMLNKKCRSASKFSKIRNCGMSMIGGI